MESGEIAFMHNETRRIMKGLRYRLTRLVRLENEHCGHDEGVRKAVDCREDIERFIEREVEAIIERRGAL